MSTVPYVTKFTGAVTKVDAKASSATRWAEQSSEREDWQEAVARRKQALLAKQGDAGPKGKVQQTQILTGLDRAGEKGDGKREWKRGSMKQANTAPTEKPWQKRQREAEEARRTQVPVNRQPSDGADAPTANAHAMVAQARPGTDSPSQQPRAAKINDAQTYMSGLKVRLTLAIYIYILLITMTHHNSFSKNDSLYIYSGVYVYIFIIWVETLEVETDE